MTRASPSGRTLRFRRLLIGTQQNYVTEGIKDQEGCYLERDHFTKGEIMKTIRTSKFVVPMWSTLALVAIAFALTGTPASSASRPGGDSGVTGPVSADASTGPATEVKIDNFVFSPTVVTVKVGAQVSWVNKDDIPHTVDSTEGKFKSAAIDTDEKFQFRFTEPGEYPFYCRLHPKMTGKIIVQP